MWWVNDIFDIQSGALITQVNIKDVKHSKSGTKIENKLNIELTENILLTWGWGSYGVSIMNIWETIHCYNGACKAAMILMA